MIYMDPDDPEAGYFGEDGVRYCPKPGRPGRLRHCTGLYLMDWNEDDTDFVLRHVIPADCSICGDPIPEDATVPLCKPCEGSARAHAKVDQAHREWVADGSPR